MTPTLTADDLDNLQRFLDMIPHTVEVLREATDCPRPIGAWVTEPAANSLELAHWLLTNVPAADHSMCARLVPKETRFNDYVWELENPDGSRGIGLFGFSDADAQRKGYAIPAEPTIVERVAEAVREWGSFSDGTELAQALCDSFNITERDGDDRG